MFRVFAYVAAVAILLALGWWQIDTIRIASWMTVSPDDMAAANIKIATLASISLLMLFALFRTFLITKTPNNNRTGYWFDVLLGILSGCIFLCFLGCQFGTMPDFLQMFSAYLNTGTPIGTMVGSDTNEPMIVCFEIISAFALAPLVCIIMLLFVNKGRAKNVSWVISDKPLAGKSANKEPVLKFHMTTTILASYILGMTLFAYMQVFTSIPNANLHIMYQTALQHILHLFVLFLLVRTVLRVCLNLIGSRTIRVVINSITHAIVFAVLIEWTFGIAWLFFAFIIAGIAAYCVYRFSRLFALKVYEKWIAFST
jgi:hypothetical protein